MMAGVYFAIDAWKSFFLKSSRYSWVCFIGKLDFRMLLGVADYVSSFRTRRVLNEGKL